MTDTPEGVLPETPSGFIPDPDKVVITHEGGSKETFTEVTGYTRGDDGTITFSGKDSEGNLGFHEYNFKKIAGVSTYVTGS